MRLSRKSLALAALLAACSKPGPSPQYEQARSQWRELEKAQPVNAYLDPAVDDILKLLAQVDPKSLDGQDAAALRSDIEKGRAEAKEREAARETAMKQADEAPAAPAFAAAPAAPAPAAEPAAPPSEKKDDGQPKEDMSASDFKSKFSRCFEYKHPSIVGGGTAGGEVWGLKDLSICRDLHPSFTSNSVLLFEDKVYAIRSSEELAPKKYKMVGNQLVRADGEEPAAPKKADEAGAAQAQP